MKISNYRELELKIAELNQQKLIEEKELENSIHMFIKTINPVDMLKNSLTTLTKDKTTQIDLAKLGLNLGANFIIEKALGKNESIKGFLSSVALELFSTPFINSNSSKLIKGISNLFNRKAKKQQSD